MIYGKNIMLIYPDIIGAESIICGLEVILFQLLEMFQRRHYKII